MMNMNDIQEMMKKSMEMMMNPQKMLEMFADPKKFMDMVADPSKMMEQVSKMMKDFSDPKVWQDFMKQYMGMLGDFMPKTGSATKKA